MLTGRGRVNAVSLSDIQNGLYEPGCLGICGAPTPLLITHPTRHAHQCIHSPDTPRTGTRVFLFIGLLISFGAVVAAVWILAGDYAPSHEHIYGGVAILLQNLLILARCEGSD